MKLLISESIASEESGVGLDRQSMVNFIENDLTLNVKDVRKLEDELSIYDVYEIVATKGNLNYIFIGEYYNFNEFNARENKLVLKEISGPEGVYETDEAFYLTNADISKKGKELLDTPLKDLIAGVNVDREFEFALGLLQENLAHLPEYEFTRSSPRSMESFQLNVMGVRITSGFSNTFQVEFDDSPLQFVQIMFRKLEDEEVENRIRRLCNLIENYVMDLNGTPENIKVDGHSISLLMNVLGPNIKGKVNTSLLIDGSEVNRCVLINKFIVGGYSSYKQFEVEIHYDFERKMFLTTINYLFNVEVVDCDSVDELINLIEDLEDLIK